ncbi:hypothetical protein FRB91_004592 [Serendipita sp. 411]|nr:hypothetical protein FRB91_004592 [Serendipita sp. 411]
MDTWRYFMEINDPILTFFTDQKLPDLSQIEEQTEACHRCSVLGISCVFDADAQANLAAIATNTKTSLDTSPTNGITDPTDKFVQGITSSSLEQRVVVIEAALRQILALNGLQPLESIADVLRIRGNKQAGPTVDALELQGTPREAALISPTLCALPRSFESRSPYSTPIDAGLITQVQSLELTSIFELRYNHCLYTPILKSQRMTLERPFTFTVMCALALRLKTTIPNQQEIMSGVHRLLQSHLAIAMSARPYTVDAIHALLIISLWSSVLASRDPVNGHQDVPDGWLLLSIAVRMAQTLRLDHDTEDVLLLLRNGKPGERDYEDALERKRVWYTLVTYDMALSLGSVKKRLTSSAYDLRFVLGIFAQSPADRCLMYHLETLGTVSKVYQVTPPTDSTQVLQYALGVEGVMKGLRMLGQVAEATCHQFIENPQACTEYRMFRLYHQYCGCVCLSHACGALSSLINSTNGLPESEAADELDKLDAAQLVYRWMSSICDMAERVILEAFPLDSREAPFLSTAPDHLFTIIAFSAVLLIQSQVTALKFFGDSLPHSQDFDNLVARTSEHLSNLVLPDSQLPRRYARVLASILRRWKNQRAEWMHKKGPRVNSVPSSKNPSEQNSEQVAGSQNGRSSRKPTLWFSLPCDEVPSIDHASEYLDPAMWLTETGSQGTPSTGTGLSPTTEHPVSVERWMN